MSQSRQFQMGGGDRSNAGQQQQQQLGDTTLTKIFVGGLAWETKRDTMRRYFEPFGEILEAVVITDKNTGRSKGYGFVTFKDPDSAMRACQDPSPVIDGRRANCNLASLGARPSGPPTPQPGVGRYRSVPGSAPTLYHGTSTAYFNQHNQYPFPNSAYGYSGYSQDSMYPMNYYPAYGGQQFAAPYYTTAAAAAGMYQNYYHPYYTQFAQNSQSQGLGMQYPQTAQYPYLPQQFGAGVLSLPASVASSPGVVGAPPTASSSTQARTLTTKEQNSTA